MSAAAASTDSTESKGQGAGPLLCFVDSWVDLNTKDVSFDKVLQQGTGSCPISLEYLRDMDSLRMSTVSKHSTIAERLDAAHIARFESYLTHLSRVSATATDGSVVFQWTSPFGGKPKQFYKCKGVLQEQVMAAFQFAGALRALAYDLVTISMQLQPAVGPDPGSSGSSRASYNRTGSISLGRHTPSASTSPSPTSSLKRFSSSGSRPLNLPVSVVSASDGSVLDVSGQPVVGTDAQPVTAAPPPEAAAEPLSPRDEAASSLADAATYLRRAAGVHQWLAQKACPLIHASLPTDRAAELLPGASACMAVACQAEAQAITAHRAGQRGTSPATTAALHVAAADLFDEASRCLKEATGQFSSISDRLRRYLAISSALQRGAAYKFLAEDSRLKGKAGPGEACCQEGAHIVQSCLPVADVDPSWKHLVQEHAASIEAFRKRCEYDRMNVTYETVAKVVPPLPPGKVLAQPLAYDPTGV